MQKQKVYFCVDVWDGDQHVGGEGGGGGGGVGRFKE